MSASPKPRIYLENTPTVERLVPALAVAIGLNESIMLLQIDFWIGQTDNFIDGKYWTYQSVRDMHTKAFPYWSIATINRTVASLQSQGLLHTANYNKRKGDKTRWFALNLEGLKRLGEKVPSISVIHGAFQNETPITQNETPSAQNETTLPEITTETTTEEQPARAIEPEMKPVTLAVAPKPEPEPLPERPNAFTLYENTFGVTITYTMAQVIKDALKEFTAEWVEDAIREAAVNNAKSWRYVEKVLDRWKREGRRAKVISMTQPPKLTYIVAPPPDDDDYVTETKSA